MRVPGGGAPLAWVWGVRGRALSHPRLPALWAGCRGPLPTGCGCGEMRAWGPVTNPTARALASWRCALWGRHKGARGGRLLPGCGASGVGRSPTPDCPPSGRAAGAHYPLAVGAGGCKRGDPSPTPQRALASWLCTLWGRHEGAQGGRLLPGCGASGVWRSPTPDCPPSGRAAGAHYQLAVGAGGCGCGDPSPTPQRALLRAGFARCGGGMRLPRGAPLAWVTGVWGRALYHPQLPALSAGCRGPLPTCSGCGGLRAWGPVTNPTARALSSWLCALWGRHEGVRGGRLLPGCGASGVGRSPTPDCPPSGRAAGAHYPLAVGAGGCGRGDPSPTPQRALLRAGFARCGGGMRVPGGAPLAWVWGVRGRALSQPPLPALWAGCRGPLPTGCGCGGVRAWGPVTNPTARALSSWLCALWARHEGTGGGGASCLDVGRPGSGALPSPNARPLGGLPGPTTHWLWLRGGLGVGPVTNPTARALSSWLCALWGRHEGTRGGAPPAWVWGVQGSGALPPPTARPLGGLPGPTTHWLWLRGGVGVGTRHQPHSARSFKLALRAVGAARGHPGRGTSCLGVGRSGVGRSPNPDCPPSGRAAGAHYPLAVVAGGCGRGDPSPTPQRALLPAGFARCGGGMRVPEGAPPAWVWGVRGRALSRPRLPALWAGCRSPLPTGCGCGGARAWGPVTSPTARALSSSLCALWGRHEGARGGRLLPGCGASVVGRSPTPNCPPFGRAAGLLCVCVPCLAGSGGLASRARFGAPHLSFGLPCFALCLFGPLRAGVALFVVVVGYFFFFVAFPLLSLAAPLLCPALRVFQPRVPWALASCPPPPFFFLAPLCAPRCLLLACFPAWRALGLGVLLFLLCVPCPARSLCCARRLCCFWWLVLLAPGVAAFCWQSAGGSGCLALSFGGVCPLWCPCLVWPSLGALPVVSRSPVLCPVALCCRVVLCCGALSPFFCFSPCWWRWFPVVPRWLWAPGRFRVVSVSVLCLCGAVLVCLRRCSLFGALLPSRGWLVFCVVACCVCVFAVGPRCPLLSPGGSWWLLVSCLGGVLWCVPGCCAAPCCCALCCLALRCCALCCFVLLRLVLPRAVLCPGTLSFVLGSCAFWRRVLSCPPALCVFCCGVSLRGVVRRCASCRVRPGVSCCAFLVVSALCGVAVWPALPRCPASLCCAPWCCAAAWCRGVLSCRLVGFVSCVGVVVPT